MGDPILSSVSLPVQERPQEAATDWESTMRRAATTVLLTIVCTAMALLAVAQGAANPDRRELERATVTALARAGELQRTLLAGDGELRSTLLPLVDERVAVLRTLYAEIRRLALQPDSDPPPAAADELERIRADLDRVETLAEGGIPDGPTGTGSISGTVTSTADASPVAATVYLYNELGSYLRDASTDPGGAYTLTALAAGTYYLTTRNSAGFVDELYDQHLCVGNCSPTSGDPVVVGDGAAVTGIDFALDPGGSIAGLVTDADGGAPIVNLSLTLVDATGTYVTTPRTVGDGTYATERGLPAGSYFALTDASNGWLRELYDDIPCASSQCDPTDGTPIVVAGTATTTADFQLDAGGHISGTVTDASATPLQGVSIYVYDHSGDYFGSAGTAADGSYTVVYALPTGNFFARTNSSLGLLDKLFDDIPCPSGDCTITDGTPIGVVQGMTTPAVDFVLSSGGVIEGTVTDAVSGLPIQSIPVNIRDAAGGYITSGSTDSSGHYASSSGLLPGTYYATTSYNPDYVAQVYGGGECHPLVCDPSSGTPLEITGDNTVTADFALSPGGRVAGTVTDADSGAGMHNVFLELSDANGVSLTYNYSNPIGGYEFQSAVAPGDYYLRAYGPAGYFSEVWDDIPCATCDVTIGNPITVTAGGLVTGIDFGLRNGGLLGGRVTRSGSLDPIVGADILLYDAGGTLVTSFETDANGDYGGGVVLLAGSYFAVTSNDQGYVDELYSNIPCPGGTCDPTAGTPITVTGGLSTAGRDFGLSVGGTISGVVTDADAGQPLNGVEVQIFNGSGSLVATATTAADGSFTAGGLNTGSWYARTVAPGYHDQLWSGQPCDGACDPTTGTPIAVITGNDTPGIDFALEVIPLFADGFETGDLTAWSVAAP